MSEALVVGSGLAGTLAALTLAEAGLEVTQVAGGPGASALCGGCLDAAAASPGIPRLPWRDPLRGGALAPRERVALLVQEGSRHPYAIAFGTGSGGAESAVDALREDYAQLRERLAPHGIRIEGDLETPRFLATQAGTVRVADYALGEVAAGDLADAAVVRVADLPGLESWEPRAICRNLARDLATLERPVPRIELVQPQWQDALLDGARTPARLAARLDSPEGREAAAKALTGCGGEAGPLLVPPILGLAETVAVSETLAAAAGGVVAEVVSFAPHAMPGYRLERALGAALDAAGIERLRGQVTALKTAPALEVEITPAGETRTEVRLPQVVVLSTGRFVGGGLVAGGRAVHERLLGLPLFDEDGRRVDGVPAHRSVRKGYGNPQPLYASGVRIDAGFRPLGSDGQPAAASVVAAGDLLGGFDSGRERTGYGVAITTGRRAALAALETLRAGGTP